MAISVKNDKGEWVTIGEVSAAILTLNTGSKMRFGDRESLFDLELSETDKALLTAMKITK